MTLPDPGRTRRAERRHLRRAGGKIRPRAPPYGRFVKVDKAGHNVQGDNPAVLAVLCPFLEDIGL